MRVYPIVAGLAQRMGIPMPKLWLIPDSSPNAFATGRNPQHASVAFTAGILQTMTEDEIEGVVAHELGHVLHRDILISSVAATIATAVTFISRIGVFFGGEARDEDREEGGGWAGILMLIVAPIAALLIQTAISRSRELDADSASAKYTGNPHKLISALEKLDAYSRRLPMDATPATAHLFIIQPFTGASLMRLFSTHPSTGERIARLQRMMRD
jgi:heat shock protein HtpX